MLLIETYIVPKDSPRVRLSDISAGTFKTISSRKAFKKVIKAGLVTLNDNKAYTADFVAVGDTISIYKDESRSKKPSIHIPIDILFEDNYLAIINKPAGIEVSGNKKYTIENALPNLLKKSTQKDALDRPLPAHRLDYPTSGCLLIGKTSETLQALHLLFETRKIAKTYLAVTVGEHTLPAGRQVSEGIITVPIDGKESWSSFKILQTIASKKYGALNLVELTPHTGRRHQLRKHLLHLGNPIFGDTLYSKDIKNGKGNGIYLQAISLKFEHPYTNAPVMISCPTTKKMKEIFFK